MIPLRIRSRVEDFLLGSCLLLVSLAALAFSLYPIYVIRPFREQKAVPLRHALWVILHYRPILLVVFVLLTAAALVAWQRARWVSRLLLLAPAMGMALLAAAASWVKPY